MPETTLTLKAKDLSKAAFTSIQKSLDKTTDYFEKLAKESQQTSKGMVGSLNRLKSSLEANQQGFQSVAIGAGVVAASTGMLAKSFVTAAMTMEQMKKGLTAVMGSSQAAKIQFERLQEVAKLPGLGLQEAVQGSARLQLAGASAKDAAKQLTAFGSAVARAGGGRAELGRVVEQMAQMASKSEVLMEDFRPVVSLMPDIVKAMDAAFGTKQIEQIRAMGISSQEFIAGVTTELSKLPPVGNTAANAAENFSDKMFELKASLGEVLLPTFSKILDMMSDLVDWLNNLSDTQKAMLSWGTVITAGLATVTAGIAGLAMALPGIIAGFTTLSSVAIPALGASLTMLAANPIVLAVAGIVALSAGIAFLIKRQHDAEITFKKFSNAMSDIGKTQQMISQIEDLVNELDELRAKTDINVEESKRLIEIQNELARLAPRLVKGYSSEGNAIIAQSEIITKYIKLQKQLIQSEENLLRFKAQKRLPELEKNIEKESERLAKMEATLQKTEIGKQITFGHKAGATFWEARVMSYDEFLERVKEQNNKIQGLATERRNLELALEGGEVPSEVKPSAAKTKSAMVAVSKITPQEFKLREQEIQFIEDKYEREEELAILQHDKNVARIKESLEKAKGRVQEEAALKQQLFNEDLLLQNKLIDIKQQRGQEFLDEEGKREDELLQKRSQVAGERLKIAFETTRQIREAEIAEQERIRQAEQNRIISINELRWQQFRESQEKQLQEQKRVQEAQQAYVIAFNEQQREKFRIAQETTQRIAALDSKITLAQIDNIDDEYDRRKALCKYQVELAQKEIENEEEKLKTLKLLWLEYASDSLSTQEKLIDDVMKGWGEITKPEITKPMEERAYSPAFKEKDDMSRQISESLAQNIAAMPMDIINIFQERKQLERDAQDDILQINRDTQDRLREIQNNATLSHIEKLRQIEQEEKASAEKRKEIERDLNESKKQVFSGYVKSFLSGIAQMMAAEAQKRVAGKLMGGLGGAGGMLAGIAGGPAGIALGIGLPLAMELLGGGFDNPRHDRMARGFGRDVAMTYGASFDNPINDMRSKLSGTMSASRSLGERSAGDMLANFTQGFEQSAKGIKGGQSQGNDNSQLQGVLGRIEQRLAETPQMQLYIDGKPLTAEIRREIDKRSVRGDAY